MRSNMLAAAAASILVLPSASRAQDTSLTVAAVRAASTPVRTVDPADEDFSDLRFLEPIVGNARVVVLGEDTEFEGTSSAAKARIIKFLHREMGFGVLVLEEELWQVRQLDAAIRTGMPHSDLTRLDDYHRLYSKTRGLHEYIARQATTPKPLELVGLESWYTAYAPEYPAVFMPAIAAFFDAAGSNIINGELRTFLVAPQPGVSGPPAPAAGTTAQHQAAFRSLIALLDANVTALNRVHGRHAVTVMRLRLEDRALYGRFHDGLRTRTAADGDYTQPRETHVARVLDFLVNEHHADRKIIVWATHSQVMKNRMALGLYGHENAGDLLAAKLPAGGMISIAFTSHEGLIGDGRRLIDRVLPTMPGSLEWAAREIGPEFQLIDLRKLRGIYRTKLSPDPTLRSDWKQTFDLAFYIRTQRPLTGAR